MSEEKHTKEIKKEFINDLYLFYRYFIASHYTNSVPAPHIRILANKLMELALNGDGKHRLAVSMPPRHILADSTRIYTYNKGWTTHGELKIGDKVIGLNGKPTEIIGLSDKKICDNLILFSNGRRLLSHNGHLWGVYLNNDSQLKILSTSEISEGLEKGYKYKLPHPNYDVEYDNLEIISITKTNNTEYGQCIEIDNDDGLYLVDETFIPTHNSKSSMVTLAFPLWLLFQNPNVNIMIVTGSPKLAEKFGIQLREYVRELGQYFNVYLSNVKQASTHIMFCDKNGKLYRGNIMLASSGSGITGQDADYLILDDPYTGNDSEFTPSALQQKIDWVNRVVEQRIEPHTKYCILHTRWHPISKDCPVYTTKGWKTHGELTVGDYVLTPNGRPVKVTKVHPTVPVDNCFEFSNGDRIISGDHHLWKFHDEKNNITRLFETHEIMNRETFIGNTYVSNFKIPFNNHKLISLVNKYKVPSVEGNCITVDSKDGMYLVGRNLTPTHNSKDLIGYYKESDPNSYEFIEFPAINEYNEPLWKERYSIDELLKKKEIVGERVFQSVYQQQPIDTTSDFFNMQKLKYGFPEDYCVDGVARAWDIASSEALSNNDFTAGVKIVKSGENAVITDLVHGRFGANNKQVIQSTAMTDTPQTHIVIETGVAGAGKLLYQEWQNQLVGFIVHRAEVSGGKSKVDRATPLQNAIEDGKVYVAIEDPNTRDAFYDELSSFPVGEHDDITDATAHCFNYLFVDTEAKKRPRAKMGIVYL